MLKTYGFTQFQGLGQTFYLVVIVGSVVIVDSTTDFRIDEE